MDSSERAVEQKILIVSGTRETEVTLGVGIPRNGRCYAYLDGWEEPKRTLGMNDWQAFCLALTWIVRRLEHLEKDWEYKFYVPDCEPPRRESALSLMHGMMFQRDYAKPENEDQK
ncbi:MAG TPA: hypothetical protein V6C86_04695 [Oculatellaceae cyanobacterium]